MREAATPRAMRTAAAAAAIATGAVAAAEAVVRAVDGGIDSSIESVVSSTVDQGDGENAPASYPGGPRTNAATRAGPTRCWKAEAAVALLERSDPPAWSPDDEVLFATGYLSWFLDAEPLAPGLDYALLAAAVAWCRLSGEEKSTARPLEVCRRGLEYGEGSETQGVLRKRPVRRHRSLVVSVDRHPAKIFFCMPSGNPAGVEPPPQ